MSETSLRVKFLVSLTLIAVAAAFLGVTGSAGDRPVVIGAIYNLTGGESADLEQAARVFSDALGRNIRYRDVPLAAWTETLRVLGVPPHLLSHLAVMAELHKQGRYDRMTDDLVRLTGRAPMSMSEFVRRHAGAFAPREAAA